MTKFLMATAFAVTLASGCATTREREMRERERYSEPAYAPSPYCDPAQQNCPPSGYCPPGQNCQPYGYAPSPYCDPAQQNCPPPSYCPPGQDCQRYRYAPGTYGPPAGYVPPEWDGRGDRGENEGPQRPREEHGVEAAPPR